MEGTEATGLTLGALPSNEVQRYGLLKGHTLGGFKVVCCQNVFTPRSLKPHEYGVRVRARAPCACARTIRTLEVEPGSSPGWSCRKS